MEYNYNVNGEKCKVFVWDDDFHEYVTVRTKEKGYNRSIRQDENGKFFTWNKCKVYLENWIRISLEEFNEKIENKEFITSNDLCQMLITEGTENIGVYAPMNRIEMVIMGMAFSGSKFDENVECRIEEEYLHTPKDNYKLKLVAIDKMKYGSNKMYVMDMMSFIRDKRIKFFKLTN